MKIKLGELRRLIREVAVSPAFFSNKPVEDPLERPPIAKALGTLEDAFSSALKANLVSKSSEKYNKDTREFDDAAMKQIEVTSKKATEVVLAKVADVLRSYWKQGGGQG